MNRILNSLFILGVMSLTISSCKKDDPQPTPKPQPEIPPTPPASEVHFTKSEVSVRIGQTISTTLENFKGTLIQDGSIEGFQVTIKDNVVSIFAGEYLPGDHLFKFKGNGSTYTLKVTLEKPLELKEGDGIYDIAGTQILRAMFTGQKFEKGHVSVIAILDDRDTPQGRYVQLYNIKRQGKVFTFDLKSRAIKEPGGEALYIPDGDHKDLKGYIISDPTEQHRVQQSVATLPDGKQIYLRIHEPGI